MPASAASIARAVIVQLKAEASAPAVQARGDLEGDDVHATASRGVSGAGGSLPYLEQIQRAFGHHDVTAVRAHVGGPAAEANASLGALAYASGDAVAFAQAPDLHLAAHEAAHVVQQRGGVRLAGGVGREGDEYERNADQVADAVVRGDSAQSLLDAYAHRGSAGGSAVQLRRERSRANQLQRQLPVPETYEELETTVERWIARQVASRSPADGHQPAPDERVPDEQRIHRERDLVRGNPSLRRVWELVEARRGQTVTIVAHLTWGEERVEQVDFSTPVGQLNLEDHAVRGRRPNVTEGEDSDNGGREPRPAPAGREDAPAERGGGDGGTELAGGAIAQWETPPVPLGQYGSVVFEFTAYGSAHHVVGGGDGGGDGGGEPDSSVHVHHGTGGTTVEAEGILRRFVGTEIPSLADSFEFQSTPEGWKFAAGVKHEPWRFGPVELVFGINILEVSRERGSVDFHIATVTGEAQTDVIDTPVGRVRFKFKGTLRPNWTNIARTLFTRLSTSAAAETAALGTTAAEGAALGETALAGATAAETAAAGATAADLAAVGVSTSIAAPAIAAAVGIAASAAVIAMAIAECRNAEEVVQYGESATVSLYRFCISYTGGMLGRGGLSGSDGHAGHSTARTDLARLAREHGVTVDQARNQVIRQMTAPDIYRTIFDRVMPRFRDEAAQRVGSVIRFADDIEAQLMRAQWGHSVFRREGGRQGV